MDAIIALVVLVLGFLVWDFWHYWTSSKGAPYVPMEPEVVEAVLQMAKIKENELVYDLGSGDGRIPITVGLKYKARAIGIELDYFRVLYSKWQVLLLRLKDKVTFFQKDIFDVNLSDANVVIMYLLQETNESLREKLLKELKPGTRIVSAAFNFPDWKPLEVDEVHVTPYGPLYLYEIGKSNPTQPSESISTPSDNP